MPILNRIVIQLSDDATSVLGMSSQDRDGKPMPLTESDFAKLFPALNVAALDRVATADAALAAKSAEHAAATAALAEIQSTLVAKFSDDPDLAAIIAKAQVAQQSEMDKKLAALDAEIAAKVKARAELAAAAEVAVVEDVPVKG